MSSPIVAPESRSQRAVVWLAQNPDLHYAAIVIPPGAFGVFLASCVLAANLVLYISFTIRHFRTKPPCYTDVYRGKERQWSRRSSQLRKRS